jgi:hypothetical protein
MHNILFHCSVEETTNNWNMKAITMLLFCLGIFRINNTVVLCHRGVKSHGELRQSQTMCLY